MPGSRMRQGQSFVLLLYVAELDQVEVEGAVAPHRIAHATVAVFDRVQLVEQLDRGQLHVCQHHRIQVARRRLVNAVELDSGGFDQAGCFNHSHPRRLAELRDRGANGRLAVTQVASEGNDCATAGSGCRHERPRVIVTETSEKGTVIGALGLCTVTRTVLAAGRSSTNAATRSASVSMRSTGSRSTAATICSASTP